MFVFHQAPAFAPAPAGDAIDLLTPFAVIGAAAVTLAALGARGRVLVFGFVAAVLYVDGHGIHLSANSIANEDPVGDAERVTYFWDERFSHVEALLGWFGLVGAFALAEAQRATAPQPGADRHGRGVAVATVILLGFTFFTSTVEGQTWPLLLLAVPVFVAWARRRPRPLLRTAAGAYLLGVALLAIWALINGGVPEFTDAGLL